VCMGYNGTSVTVRHPSSYNAAGTTVMLLDTTTHAQPISHVKKHDLYFVSVLLVYQEDEMGRACSTNGGDECM
jgi:hypothetical protein